MGKDTEKGLPGFHTYEGWASLDRSDTAAGLGAAAGRPEYIPIYNGELLKGVPLSALLAQDWFSEVNNYSLVKPTTGQFTRIPVVLTGPPPGLTNKPASLLAVRSSPSVTSFR